MFRIALITIAFCLLSSSTNLWAQGITSRIVDAKTGEAVPYATIQYAANKGIVTNDEGRFSLYLDNTENVDSLRISSMGYETIAIAFASGLDSVISVNPKPIELSEVYLFDNELEVDEIIDRVKDNLEKNYAQDAIHQRLFFRKSSLDRIRKFDIDFKESTIEEFNEKFIDSVLSVMPKGNAYYTESLVDYYREQDSSRLKIEKAAELYDKDNEISMEAIGERMEKIFKENVKSDSYLKIKSGIFGTKVQVDSILEESDEAAELEEEFADPDDKDFHSHKNRQLDDIYTGFFLPGRFQTQYDREVRSV